MNGARIIRGAALLLALAPALARADGPAPCAGPTGERAPDPTCGEELDGRAPPASAGGVDVPRTMLWVPRATARVAFWPVVQTSEFIEAHQLQRWMDDLLTSDDQLVGVRPVLNYATGFLPSAGLRAFYNRLPGGSGVGARFQTAGPSVLQGELSGAGPSWTGLTVRLMANRRNDRLFAGVGPNSDTALAALGRTEARFGSDIFVAEARWLRLLPAHFQMVLHGDVQRRDYRAANVSGGPSVADVFASAAPGCAGVTSNACVDDTLVPGFAQGLRIGHAGATVAWTQRDRARDGSGVDLSFDATVGQGLASDPSRHVTFSGETSLALGGGDRLLVLHGRAAMVRTLGGAPVPFEELVSPSGNAGMRGFPEGRFRGPSGAVGTAEYRWYVSHDIDASLFSDVGTVAGPGFSGIGQRWFPDFGFGLRFYSTPDVYWKGSLYSGAQIVYAPDGGVRFLLAVAAF